MNEILLRGATPVAPIVSAPPVVAPSPGEGAGTGDFSQVLLAEMEGTAGVAPPTLTPPKITLESLPVVKPVMVAPPPAAPVAPAAGGETYTVQAGDSLSKIARKLGHGAWQTLYAANRDVVGANPNVIKPGQVLHLPETWQTAHAPAPHAVSAKPAASPKVSAAMEPAAQTSPPAGEVGNAPVASAAPVLPPPSLPVEAGIEPMPEAPADTYGPSAMPGVSSASRPTASSIATEAIDRLSAEPDGGEAAISTMREALRAIPESDPSYALYRNKVDAYAAGIVAPPPSGAAPTGQPPVIVPAPVDSAVPTGGGAGVAPIVDPPAGAAPSDNNAEEAWEAFS